MKKPSLATHLCSGGFAVAALLAFASTPAAQAITYTSDGGGTDDLFSSPANWTGSSAPVNDLANTDLRFAGNLRLTPNAQSVYSMRSLIFDVGAGAFTIVRSPLTIGAGGIVNHGTSAQTVKNILIIGADQSWNFANRGAVNLGATVFVEKSLTAAGGTINMTGRFTVDARNSAGSAVFNLAGGAFSTNTADVATTGSAVMNHSAGSFSVKDSNRLYLGRFDGSTGTYSLSGSGQLSAAEMWVGADGTGIFNQTGGSVTCATNFRSPPARGATAPTTRAVARWPRHGSTSASTTALAPTT